MPSSASESDGDISPGGMVWRSDALRKAAESSLASITSSAVGDSGWAASPEIWFPEESVTLLHETHRYEDGVPFCVRTEIKTYLLQERGAAGLARNTGHDPAFHEVSAHFLWLVKLWWPHTLRFDISNVGRQTVKRKSRFACIESSCEAHVCVSMFNTHVYYPLCGSFLRVRNLANSDRTDVELELQPPQERNRAEQDAARSDRAA